MQREEWRTQKGRSADRAAINAAIAAITRERPAAHWIALFEAAGIPCGPINTIDKVFADPQVQHLRPRAPDRASGTRRNSTRRLGDQPFRRT